ncbi:hypothetical protein [Enterococcus sp. AZ072]|uniref:hypothetical protein n=1 Tax=unclassified Enterococcus TaxID=2608891 RepID=UPI003D2E283E
MKIWTAKLILKFTHIGNCALLEAVVAILVFASTEGASPPASGSIFITAGLTDCRPEATFYPLIKYFVIPITLVGWLIAMGYLPLFV